tara:strand:+ start:784 stop:1827 length:1044 start_codon:yes stop_codon:yes gene_type:complete
MSDLLKEAIADAKAVRETALQNAKMALEEAFTPQLKSMLSAKLKEDEMEDEDVPMEDEMGDEEEEVPAEEGYYEDEEMGDDEEPAMEDEMGDEEVPMEDEMGDEDEVEEENLDLEAIIRELETELKEEDDAYDEKASPKKDGLAEEDDAYDEKASPKKDGLAEAEDDDDDEVEVDESVFTEDEDEDDDKEEVEEQSDSSKIGSGDNKVDYADAGDEEDPGKGSVHEQLKEYKEAVVFLKDKLHEVNILNAKLLFTNKLFKSYSLNNNQKLKVVETFDRAQTTREIKLVYSTLAEQFGDNGSIARKKSINESASKPVASTKPSKESRKVITEESQVANRFKKLAGIIK